MLQKINFRLSFAAYTMSRRCSVCGNLYEICLSCEKAPRRLTGCVESKHDGYHDNGGFEADKQDKISESGSWIKEGSNDKGDKQP